MHGNGQTRPGRPRVSVDLERVRGLRQRGLSWRETAEAMGLGYGTVRRAVLLSQNPVAGQSEPAHHGEEIAHA